MDLAPLCPLWLIPLDHCPSLSCFLLGRRLCLPESAGEPLVSEERWGEQAWRVCGKSELQTCLWSEALLLTAIRAFQCKPTDRKAERQGCISCDGCCVGAAVRGAAAGSCRVHSCSALDLQHVSNGSRSVLDPLFCLSTLFFFLLSPFLLTGASWELSLALWTLN